MPRQKIQDALPNDRVHYAKRKEPRQKRSKSTVESIKQAAVLLMKEEGIRAVGTDRIAEKAGVSIGSLYQYFPNREAILAAIYEDISIEFAGTLKAGIPLLLDVATELAATRIINMLLTMYERHRLVLLQLVKEMPQLRLTEQSYSFSILAHSSTRAYLVHRRDTEKPRDLERKAFFIEQIILGCINAYLRDAPAKISRKEFVRELSRIATSYLDNWQAPDAEPKAERDGAQCDTDSENK